MDSFTKIRDNLTESGKKEKRGTLVFYAVFLALIFLTVFVFHLNSFVLMNIVVSGSSMESTLQDGDKLISVRNAKVGRGDVIIINKTTHKTQEESDYYIIKRAIGIGGDVVEIKEDGKVYVNGEMLSETYLDIFQTTKIFDPIKGRCDKAGYFKWELQADEIFYLGDNRINSSDARINGPCKNSDVISVVSDWSIRNRKIITKVFNFLGGIPEWFSGVFGCGGKGR